MGVLQKAAKGTKWDWASQACHNYVSPVETFASRIVMVGNVGLRRFFGGMWWDAVSAMGYGGFLPRGVGWLRADGSGSS